MEDRSTLFAEVLSVWSGTRCGLIENGLIKFTLCICNLSKRDPELFNGLEIVTLDYALLERGALKRVKDIGRQRCRSLLVLSKATVIESRLLQWVRSGCLRLLSECESTREGRFSFWLAWRGAD